MSFHLLIQGHAQHYSSMWAVWSKWDRRKEGDSLELLSLSLLDVRHSAKAQRSKWNTISSTMLPQWKPRHYLWNNCHQPQAGATHTYIDKKLYFYTSVIEKGKKKAEVSSGCSSHALAVLEEVVLEAGNSKMKCFLWPFPKCPAIPWLMWSERRVMAELATEDAKNESSVRRRQ